MILVTSERQLKRGQVLMIHRHMQDKQGKNYTWRFFFYVDQYIKFTGLGWNMSGWILNSYDTKHSKLRLPPDADVYLLDESELPDGVLAIYTYLIMKGEIDIN